MSSQSPRAAQGAFYRGATIVPPYKNRFVDGNLAVCILDQNDTAVPGSMCSLNRRDNSGYLPDRQEFSADVTPKSGRWMFGGFYQPHFGHQITQCLGRLPWLDQLADCDGILFAGHPRARRQNRRNPSLRNMLATFGVHHPVEVVVEPVQVEELFVGPTLFGETNRCVPEPEFVDWVRKALPHSQTSVIPGKRLYVSRSRIHPLLGRILCEEILEDNLRQLGFDIYFPEAHSIEDQLKAYMQAEVIVASDGTAAHVIAFAQQPGQTLVFLARRHQEPELIVNHLRGFHPQVGGGSLHFLNCIAREWYAPGNRKMRPRAEIDFGQVFEQLHALGVFPTNISADWACPAPEDIEIAKSAGCDPDEKITVIGTAA